MPIQPVQSILPWLDSLLENNFTYITIPRPLQNIFNKRGTNRRVNGALFFIRL